MPYTLRSKVHLKDSDLPPLPAPRRNRRPRQNENTNDDQTARNENQTTDSTNINDNTANSSACEITVEDESTNSTDIFDTDSPLSSIPESQEIIDFNEPFIDGQDHQAANDSPTELDIHAFHAAIEALVMTVNGGEGINDHFEPNVVESPSEPSHEAVLPVWLSASLRDNVNRTLCIRTFGGLDEPALPIEMRVRDGREYDCSEEEAFIERARENERRGASMVTEYLDQHFCEQRDERITFHNIPSAPAAYRAFREYSILHHLSTSLHISLDNRRNVPSTRLPNGAYATVLDLYEWTSINEGTFNNKKKDLRTVYLLLHELVARIENGTASEPLKQQYRNWEPYLLPWTQLSQLPDGSRPISLKWRIGEMKENAIRLSRLLGS
ncbi:hypothetical protein PQX77_000485 [Marasmius sp. AFHP31]|nr:hypothetical protein PQX77_003592 [Marasmius sp. AFHP31]KAK1236281.1 hypothetical protein PQX77_000485 [Marasmius sp. AFHP31]